MVGQGAACLPRRGGFFYNLLDFCLERMGEAGYRQFSLEASLWKCARRLTFMMLDAGIVAVRLWALCCWGGTSTP